MTKNTFLRLLITLTLTFSAFACSNNLNLFSSDDGSMTFEQYKERLVNQGKRHKLKGSFVTLNNLELKDNIFTATFTVENKNSKPFNVFECVEAQYEINYGEDPLVQDLSVNFEKIYDGIDCPNQFSQTENLEIGQTKTANICWRNTRYINNELTTPKDVKLEEIKMSYYNKVDNIGSDFAIK